MADFFLFDVFLAYSQGDKEIARDIARKLKADGLRVWFDEWQITAVNNLRTKVEEGLEYSRILVLCMSEHAFNSNWARLESYTFRFRDPLNKNRRFIPLRLDRAPVNDSLLQFQYISWLKEDRDHTYAKLVEACQNATLEQHAANTQIANRIISLGHTDSIQAVTFSPNGEMALSGSRDYTIRCWEVQTGKCLGVMGGHTDSVLSVAWSPDGMYALSGSEDKTIRYWEVRTGKCLLVIEGHLNSVMSVAWSPDGVHALSGSLDKTIRLWEVNTGSCLRVIEGHTNSVLSVAWSPDGIYALSGSDDSTIRYWEIATGKCLRVMKAHTSSIWSIAWSPDGKRALSGCADRTIRLWDIDTGKCLKVLEEHKDLVLSVAWDPDGVHAISGSFDLTIRYWKVNTGKCLRVMKEHKGQVWSVAISPDGTKAISGSKDNTILVWDVSTKKCLLVLDGHKQRLWSVAWSHDGRYLVSGSNDRSIRLWDVNTGICLRILEGHGNKVLRVAWSYNDKYILSSSDDHTIRIWEIQTGKCLRILEGRYTTCWSVAWSYDDKFVLSASDDKTIQLWNVENGKCLRVLEGHTRKVMCVAWDHNDELALSSSDDKTIRLWDVDASECLRVLKGHTSTIWTVAWSPDDKQALSGSNDCTIRLWDISTGECLRVMEGHTDTIWSVAWSHDGRFALSGSSDKTVRLWEVDTGICLYVLHGHTSTVWNVAWNKNNFIAYSAAANGVTMVWDFSKFFTEKQKFDKNALSQVQYTNAKVLLVGDTGVGKTGLSNNLAHGIKDNGNNTSTDGAWATQWKLPHDFNKVGVEREIWLWDFAGQVDYRLVHQLFMDETAAAVLVFNPQQENPFEGLGQWDRDLQRSSRKTFSRLLAAGRIDRGGLIVSDSSMQKFMQERGFLFPLHVTSAKTGEGCEILRNSILEAINWQNIPETTSPVLYHKMKQEMLQLRDSGMVLIRLAELKQRIELALSEEHFTVEELQAVIGLLDGPGMIQRLDFGGFILLRPEVLSRYAAAVVRKVRKHPQELGCIREDDMLGGVLDYQDFERLPQEDEKIILRALHETLINRAWCLRQPCDGAAQLIFPSYFRRERPEQPHRPNVQVTYRFAGPVDDIYASLVVRLHHTEAFESDQLWKDAADFKTQADQGLGLKLVREAEGSARLEIYFNTDVDENMRLVFARYIHNHLNQYGKNVERLRHYFCGNKKCDAYHQPFTDQARIDKALAKGGKGKVFCSDCGKPILLRDAMEQKFESPDIKEKTHQEEEQSQLRIDNESQELILVGHAFSITAEAGQIFRPIPNSDHGIDGEIEFKDDQGRATGKKLYVQLKSGDSYLRERKKDGVEVYQIKNPRWVDYWQQHAYPVFLVIRNSKGDIRWMEVSDNLKRNSIKEGKPVTQIVFQGEPFDVMSIRRWRDKALSKK